MIILQNKKLVLERNVSPNFKGKEFRCNCGNCHLTFIDPVALALLQATRNQYGKPISMTSAYRCQAYNISEAVDGDPYSYHPQGKAFDLPLSVAEVAKKIFPWHYMGDGFIHVDTRGL